MDAKFHIFHGETKGKWSDLYISKEGRIYQMSRLKENGETKGNGQILPWKTQRHLTTL